MVLFHSKKKNVYASCLAGKLTKQPFGLSDTSSSHALALVHSDLWGPAPVISNNGYRFYLLLVDDYSGFTWLYPLYRKSEVLSCFKHFKSMVESALNSRIKCLKTDGGGEFTSKPFAYL